MQHCRSVGVNGETLCKDDDVQIQVTNLETGLSYFPALTDLQITPKNQFSWVRLWRYTLFFGGILFYR